jgi:hypothetical protein
VSAVLIDNPLLAVVYRQDKRVGGDPAVELYSQIDPTSACDVLLHVAAQLLVQKTGASAAVVEHEFVAAARKYCDSASQERF